MYNKFRISSVDTNCLDYQANGAGASKYVNVAQKPIADFNLEDTFCMLTDSVIADNISVFGQWGIPPDVATGELGTDGECSNLTRFRWSVKSPSSPFFEIIENITFLPGADVVLGGWATGSSNDGYVDLNLPPTYFTAAGCYQLRLQAQNPSVCTGISSKIIDINIEDAITPEFEILNSSNIIVSEICAGETVHFDDVTGYEECDGSTFSWTITAVGIDGIANNGEDYVYAENNNTPTNLTNSSFQEPFVQFITAGNYLVTQIITNSCGSFTSEKPLLVKGAPFVLLPLNSSDICKYPENLPFLIDFGINVDYKPTFSEEPFAPSSYTWLITGVDVSASDYVFVGGTSSSSEFPQIQFNSFFSITLFRLLLKAIVKILVLIPSYLELMKFQSLQMKSQLKLFVLESLQMVLYLLHLWKMKLPIHGNI